MIWIMYKLILFEKSYTFTNYNLLQIYKQKFIITNYNFLQV